MNSKPHREWFPPEPPEGDIRQRAFALWLNDGQVHGRDLDHWLAARQLLLHEAKEHHENSHPSRGAGPLPEPALAGDLPRRLRNHRARVGTTGAAQRLRARHQPRRTSATFVPQS